MKIFVLIAFVCLLSCQENKKETTSQVAPLSELITEKDINALKYLDFEPDSKVNKLIENWAKYKEVALVITDVKQANMSFFKDNSEILTALIEELKTTIPESINSPLIAARLTALETKMYKLESEVNLSNSKKEALLACIKELLESFSNLNLQMNKKIEKESQNIQKPD